MHVGMYMHVRLKGQISIAALKAHTFKLLCCAGKLQRDGSSLSRLPNGGVGICLNQLR